MTQKTVVVGLSGGVDSSVSALLLKEQGYRVIALFMKNWKEDAYCPQEQDVLDARRVCDGIGIPFYVINFSQEYETYVFNYFLQGYEKGITPNPDILCNREIKFRFFWEKARDIGADYMATGHYARIKKNHNKIFLLKGKDCNKDQSYFLYAIRPEILAQVIFPIGDLVKAEVRQIAKKFHLGTAEKKDSTGICFIGQRPFKEFLSQFITPQPGNIYSVEGKKVGVHSGCYYYTIGQRQGLGIGGEGEAWFVVKKNIEDNALIVAQGALHPALFSDTLLASQLHWLVPPHASTFSCAAKIRYRQTAQKCNVELLKDANVRVTFEAPQRAITLGQSVVFYKEEVCLGGGMIAEVGKSYYDLDQPLPISVSL